MTFMVYLQKSTWWWAVVLTLTFFHIVQESNSFIVTTFGLWLVVKVVMWRRVSNVTSEVVSASTESNVIRPKMLVSTLAMSIVFAYFIAEGGPDHRAYYQDLPYQAARESGYSHNQARDFAPQINMAHSVLGRQPTGIFRTLNGWIWFFILTALYSWRLYVFADRRWPVDTTKEPDSTHSGGS